MTPLERMHDVLPLPYSVAGDSLVTALLNDWALQLEALEEDLDRLRRSHWIDTVYRDADLDRLAALVDVRRFAGEPSKLFRERLLALVKARLAGTIGPLEIHSFVVSYLAGLEKTLECVLVPRRMKPTKAQKVTRLADLVQLVEWPARTRRSRALADRGGRVTHLFRWSERNDGLDPAPVTFLVHGALGRATTMPALINLTTLELFGWRGVVPFGKTLVIENGTATLEGRDVTPRLFAAPLRFGEPLELPAPGAPPAVPMLARGVNEWQFATIGFFDERGYDHVHFMLEDPGMTEAVFDGSAFDQALFPAGTLANVEMSWIEKQGASFEVHVPRKIVVEPRTLIDDFARAGATRPPHEEIAEDLRETVQQLRAAGVRAGLHLDAFRETQRQTIRFALPWLQLPPEQGSAGEHDEFAAGARFGESAHGRSRFN